MTSSSVCSFFLSVASILLASIADVIDTEGYLLIPACFIILYASPVQCRAQAPADLNCCLPPFAAPPQRMYSSFRVYFMPQIFFTHFFKLLSSAWLTPLMRQDPVKASHAWGRVSAFCT